MEIPMYIRDEEEFAQVCQLYDDTYSRIKFYPKYVSAGELARENRNPFSNPIWDRPYLTDQIANNCRYKKHKKPLNAYLCDDCLKIDYIFTFKHDTFTTSVKNGKLRYDYCDYGINPYRGYIDPYGLRCRIVNRLFARCEYLIKSVENLLILKKQILAMNQIIAAQKAKKESIQWIQFRYWWDNIYPIGMLHGLPREIITIIAMMVVFPDISF
jgi:hypothetical protein